MKSKKFKKFVAKSALPLILGGTVVLAGATGAYFYVNKQDEDKVVTSEEQPTQTEGKEKGDNLNTSEQTTPTTPDTTTNNTDIGDVSLSITIDDPAARNTATVSFYGPAGTYGVEKLISGTWTAVVAKFSYSGTGGRVIDNITSSAAETHYRVFSLSGDTKTATSGDTVVNWNLVNENGIYTIPIAR